MLEIDQSIFFLTIQYHFYCITTYYEKRNSLKRQFIGRLIFWKLFLCETLLYFAGLQLNQIYPLNNIENFS